MECGNWVIFKERWDWIAAIYIYAFFMQCTHKNSFLVALSMVFGKKGKYLYDNSMKDDMVENPGEREAWEKNLWIELEFA